MSDLSDRLARLAKRGTERGADAVFASARLDAATPAKAKRLGFVNGTSKLAVATALAASITLIAGIAAAVRFDGQTDAPKHFAAGTTTTTIGAPATTSTPASPATKIYLASTRLVPFDQCPDLARYAQNKALAVVGPYGLPGANGGVYSGIGTTAGGPAMQRAERDSAAASAPQTAGGSGASSAEFSTTNVQEAGIDEPDTVKTDGKTIFTVTNGRVFATKSGDNPAVLSSVRVDNAREILLDGNRLIVVSDGGFFAYPRDSRQAGGSGGASFAPMPNGQANPSRFTVVDVSDPAAMKSTGSFDVDGNYVSARLVDGVARMVVRSSPRFAFSYPTDGTPEAQTAATQRNREVVQAATADTWLPHFSFTNAAGQTSPSKPLASCSNSYRPPAFAGFGMLSVVSFNAANPAASKTTSVMADGDIVYASSRRVYVATNKWGAVTDRNVQPTSNTLIHTFDITDSSNATYLFSGQVRGTVLNQFSMSEYAGALRVATTDATGGSESFVTVLGDAGDALVPVGVVGGLGKGERIYAVRFIGPVGYVVTFRQFDPLYVVDLHDASNPRVVGSLEVSGYSAYLHPIGDGLLLAVGAEVINNEPEGVQVSIYNVRNPSAPALVTRKQLGQGISMANFDHHAFLYWAATRLAVLPVQNYGQNGQSFNGAVGLRVNPASLDEVGRVQPPNSPNGGGIERTLVIGNRVYATSPSGVLVATLDTLAQTGWVAYPTS